MKGGIRQLTSFAPAVRVLLVSQFAINTGYYLLYPYLAVHMQRDLGLSAWLLGVVLGAGTLSQQGLFLIGGTLSDRLGPRRVIISGLLLRTVGFLSFAFSTSLPGLLLAAVLSGFAGALFNPAVRAYVAQAAEARRVEAFAIFSVFANAGLLLGPVLGSFLVGLDFHLAGVSAAAVFLILAVLQSRVLPSVEQSPAGGTALIQERPRLSFAQLAERERRRVIRDWATALRNRPFVLLSVGMLGYFALYVQFYLGLLLAARLATGDESGVAPIFVISAVLGIVAQVHVMRVCQRYWTPARAVAIGLVVMSSAFLLLGACVALPTSPVRLVQLAPVLLAAAILMLGTLIAQPFALDLTASLGDDDRLVGTYFGVYYLSLGIGGAAGNLLIGTTFDFAQATRLRALPWALLAAVGTVSALAVLALERRGTFSRSGWSVDSRQLS